MNTQDAIGWFILAAPVLAAAGGLVGAALIKSWRPAREVAVVSADYIEAVKCAVETAERYGLTNQLPGVEKFGVAVKEMDAWLDAQGIHGDAKAVTMERVRADIELMRARLFPARVA